MKSKLLPLYLLVIILVFSCKKDIELPDPNLKDLFGEWKWVGSYGFGESNLPTKDYWYSIEFDQKGFYKEFHKDKFMVKMYYSIIQEESKFGNYIANVLRYKEIGYPKPYFYVQKEIKFIGKDTLVLTNIEMDSFVHTYVRKK